MLDFASVLYLGFRHARETLRPWKQLTTGLPAALAEAPEAVEIAAQLARLQGCEAGVLAPSTLHLFWDLFGLFGQASIFVDEGAYAIAQWGAERAAARGAPVITFPHHNPAALERSLAAKPPGRQPVVVVDGVCADSGEPLPLAAYLDLAKAHSGLLIIDDTQALGLFGSHPGPLNPFGSGGGGSLRLAGVQGANILLICSLAKGFGAPLAALSGSRRLVRWFSDRSQTRVHCSPPSIANLRGAQAALDENRRAGDVLRRKLAANIQAFQWLAAASGLTPLGGLFPVQGVLFPNRDETLRVYGALEEQGVRTVLRRGSRSGPLLSLVITARHSLEEIEQVVQRITSARSGGAAANRSDRSAQSLLAPRSVQRLAAGERQNGNT